MSLDVLKQYLSEFNSASSLEEKWAIASRYSAVYNWRIKVPIIAGEYIDGYWVIDDQIDSIGQARIAVPERDEGTMRSYIVRVVDDYVVLVLTGAALMTCE